MVFAEMGLRPTGERSEFPDVGTCAAAMLPGGWLLIAQGHDSQELLAATDLPQLSRGCDLVTCSLLENVAWSKATGWSDGRQTWSITYDPESTGAMAEGEGDLPPGFPAICERRWPTDFAADTAIPGVRACVVADRPFHDYGRILVDGGLELVAPEVGQVLATMPAEVWGGSPAPDALQGRLDTVRLALFDTATWADGGGFEPAAFVATATGDAAAEWLRTGADPARLAARARHRGTADLLRAVVVLDLLNGRTEHARVDALVPMARLAPFLRHPRPAQNLRPRPTTTLPRLRHPPVSRRRGTGPVIRDRVPSRAGRDAPSRHRARHGPANPLAPNRPHAASRSRSTDRTSLPRKRFPRHRNCWGYNENQLPGRPVRRIAARGYGVCLLSKRNSR